MNEKFDTDIVIAGGGMVGAALACALAQGGRKVVVVEAREPQSFAAEDAWDLRVSAVNRAAQRFFERLGAWAAMRGMRVSPYSAMHVWDAGSPGEIHFDAADLGEPDLGHIIENRVMQLALLERLAAHTTATLITGARIEALEVTAAHATVTLDDGRRLRARLVVGADGARSHIRDLAGIALDAHPYHQQGVVGVVKTERPHENTCWQRFLPGGPIAFLPLRDGRSSIVWTVPEHEADALARMDEESFCEELGRALDHRLGAIVETGPRAAFPLRGSQAVPYVKPRIALVGDAAHTIHPLAGQGVNLGFRDAMQLAETLLAHDGDPGELRVLRRYERARRADNVLTMRSMEGFRLLFGNEQPLLARLRGLGLGAVDRLTPLKHAFMRAAMGE